MNSVPLHSILLQFSLPSVFLLATDTDYKLGFPAYDCLNAFLTTWEIRKRGVKFGEAIALALLAILSGSIIIGISS